MKLLILGYSNVVKKKIIKSLIKSKTPFSLASKSFKKKLKYCEEQYTSYQTALSNSKADTVYVSLPNSMHYKYAKKALELNFNVIIDKPICSTSKELKKLIILSIKKNKLISEATFYNFHKQFKLLKKFIKKEKIFQIEANFLIPKPKKYNFRLSQNLGGGAWHDMSSYISSIVSLLIKSEIKKKSVFIKKENKIITFISFLIHFKNDILYYGNFRFGASYKNQILIRSKNKEFIINRAFSPPDNQELDITINKENKKRSIKIKPDVSFENYLKYFKKLKKKKYEWKGYLNNLEKDFLLRETIIKKAKEI